MYTITIVLKNANTTPVVMLYKDVQTFDAAKMAVSATDRINLTDDFENELRANIADIAAFKFENMDQARLALIEFHLHQQRTQQMLQTRVEADPSYGRRSNTLLSPIPAFNGRG